MLQFFFDSFLYYAFEKIVCYFSDSLIIQNLFYLIIRFLFFFFADIIGILFLVFLYNNKMLNKNL